VDIQDIRRIVELMNEHGLTLFDLTKKDFHLKLKKGNDVEDLRSLLSALPTAPAAAFAPAPNGPSAPVIVSSSIEAAPAAPKAEEGVEITSPMVGTFYSKPAPDAPNFVEVGSTVSIGQTVCIIEAMKVMNEIKAEKAGTITAIIAEDGKPVQFGDALFRIR
jgi:acetyl-CoA carboxylase biotin carboxyl carrier protein